MSRFNKFILNFSVWFFLDCYFIRGNGQSTSVKNCSCATAIWIQVYWSKLTFFRINQEIVLADQSFGLQKIHNIFNHSEKTHSFSFNIRFHIECWLNLNGSQHLAQGEACSSPLKICDFHRAEEVRSCSRDRWSLKSWNVCEERQPTVFGVLRNLLFKTYSL